MVFRLQSLHRFYTKIIKEEWMVIMFCSQQFVMDLIKTLAITFIGSEEHVLKKLVDKARK